GIHSADGLDEGFAWFHPAQIEGVHVTLHTEAVVQRVHHQVELAAPPPIEGGTADLRVGRDVTDCHAGIAVPDQAVAGGRDDRLVEFRVAWPATGTRAGGVDVRALVPRFACCGHQPTS